ncbi:uncharacterized protein LOC126686376 [Mercurialis annua]|uniref:uncharacterized protein LOC126686376 n=1 Tax=Mercurialis annua TaxID=3986 RepID=UPI002160CC44|nr:uncharacterized protein LOC126686376 [Mercurialis annua]
MGKKKKAPSKLTSEPPKPNSVPPQDQNCYEGDNLARLLKLIQGGVESAKLKDQNALPEKFWFKQQFAIGANEVTRVLERMMPVQKLNHPHRPPIQLQAILIASDSNPKYIKKHLLSLALSRKVPVILVKDSKRGSVRLGELVRLKTALALGIKAKGNSINHIVEKILSGGNDMNIETECFNTTKDLSTAPSR